VNKIKPYLEQTIGVIGTIACLAIFIHKPSFPTPDKIIVFLAFVFMIFKQALPMLKRLLPFVLIILAYESFRSVADKLNSHVNYYLAPHFDQLIFGKLPALYLQQWFWKGHTSWYDVVLYIPYLLFFALPLALAILVWKTRDKYYWQVVGAYSLLFFAAFVTFLVFPAAPPWLAAQNHYIPDVIRVSSYVWASMGIHDFPSVYNHLAANPVAAVPSLHSACSTLFAMIIFKLYGKRWGMLSLLYPILIYIGVVYEGEHYFFDVVAGIIYAVAAYYASPYLILQSKPLRKKLSANHYMLAAKAKYSSSTKSASKSA
jgi:membrane-associated phospholipid phosphatase